MTQSATLWQQREPPATWQDRVTHTDAQYRQGTQGWLMIGASRRGRLHAHEGTFREDAFQLDTVGDWALIAVADGAGSYPLSRVGANRAVQTAITTMRTDLEAVRPSHEIMRLALQTALEAAWQALDQEATHRQDQDVYFKDLSTTLLLLAFHTCENLVGVAQIGDGLLVAQLVDGTIHCLGEPDNGDYSSQTQFLTTYAYDDLASKIDFPDLPAQAALFLVMTDGLSDDLYPPQKCLPGLIKPLSHVIQQAQPEQVLLDLLAYERVGSFDDRTLVVLWSQD